MPPARRRIAAGLPLGAVVAILIALVASRSRTPDARSTDRGDGAGATTEAPAARTGRPGGVDASSAERPRLGTNPGFTSRERLVEHFEKHGEEFPGLTMATYLAAAQELRDAATGGEILEVRRSDGVATRFDRRSGAFLAVNRDRTIRTFFKPNDGERYFRRQASRTPGGGP